MNVTTFRIQNPTFERIGGPVHGYQKATYKIPTLPAYAILDSQLELTKNLHIDVGYIPAEYELMENGIVITNNYWDIFGPPEGILTVYHNGIKDYELLFPHIKNSSLKKRIGQFAEEASKAFENQAWISYCLMVGGVLEGLLYNQFGNKLFKNLIECAKQSEIITPEEASLIDDMRHARNKIHANRHQEDIVNRKIALELSIAYDKLVKREWDQ